jgi:hypothetical protein
VHTTLEQCLMSITTIAHQAQGMRAGEVIAKLAEDAYFMRVDNVVWTSLGPLPRWVPRPTTRWAPGTTRLVPHGT